MNTSTEAAANHRSTGTVRVFSILNGLALLCILLQGVSAGGLVGRVGGVGWLRFHQIIGFTALIIALVAAIVAVATLRRFAVLAWGATALFVLLVIQNGVGSSIGSVRPLLLVHVPLAMLIMGLGVYLSVAGGRARRA